jgi:hypothetical protein
LGPRPPGGHSGGRLWAARLLRPGGRLVFLVNSALAMLCMPDDEDEPLGDRLLRPYFEMHRFEWPDDESVEFHLPHGELIRLLRECGFEIEELIDVRPPDRASTRYTWATLEWSRRWPVEEVWKVRKRSQAIASAAGRSSASAASPK